MGVRLGPQNWLRYWNWEVTRGTWGRQEGKEAKAGWWHLGLFWEMVGHSRATLPGQGGGVFVHRLLIPGHLACLELSCLAAGTGLWASKRARYIGLQRPRGVGGGPWLLIQQECINPYITLFLLSFFPPSFLPLSLFLYSFLPYFSFFPSSSLPFLYLFLLFLFLHQLLEGYVVHYSLRTKYFVGDNF